MADNIWSKVQNDALRNISWSDEPAKEKAKANWANPWVAKTWDTVMEYAEGMPNVAALGGQYLKMLRDYNAGIKNPDHPEWEASRDWVVSNKDIDAFQKNMFDTADYLHNNWRFTSDREPQGLEGVAVDLVSQAPQFAIQAAASPIPMLGDALMFASIAGNQFHELVRDKGVDPNAAAQMAGLNGAIQTVLEHVGFETIKNRWQKGHKKGTVKSDILVPGLAEGGTEFLQEIPDELTDYYAEHGTLDGFDWGTLVKNGAYAAFLGGTWGGILGGLGHAVNRKRDQNEKVTYNPETDAPALDAASGNVVNGTNDIASGTTDDNNTVTIDADAVVTNAADNNNNNIAITNNNEDRVGTFLNAIAGQETGGESDPYNAHNAEGDAHGKYQITTDTYRAYAEEAGVDPDNMTPENQEIVARYMAGKYIQQYGEDGAIVAWYAGEGTAQAFVNGTLSEEAFTKRQGEHGEYPSIKEYLDMVHGRMGKGGGVTITPTQTTQASQPRSAADFLKDIEDTDTLEDEEASDRLHNTLTRGTKEEQEELAREYGWNPEQEQQQAQQPTQQGKAPQQTQTTTAQVAQPTQRSAGAVEPITTQQGAGTVQQTNTANGAPAKQNATPTTRAIAPRANNARQATDPTQTIVGNERQPTPAVASPIESGKTPVEQPQQTEQPKTNEEKLINKAKTNEKLKTVVKQAFVDGDKKAQQLLNSQHINPNVLEAVKGMVIPNYVPQGSVNAAARAANARAGVQSNALPTATANTQNSVAGMQNSTGTTENAKNGSAAQSDVVTDGEYAYVNKARTGDHIKRIDAAIEKDEKEGKSKAEEIGGKEPKAASKTRAIITRINKILKAHYAGQSTTAETIARLQDVIQGIEKARSKSWFTQETADALSQYCKEKIAAIEEFDRRTPEAEREAVINQKIDIQHAKDSIDDIIADRESGKITKEEAAASIREELNALTNNSMQASDSMVSHVYDTIKRYVDSLDTDKSNTEEKTNETTKEIRELLPETNEDKHGDTKSEKGGKPESKDGAQTETKDTVKDEEDTSDNEPFNSPMNENERQIYDKADPDIKSNEWEDVSQTPETLERSRDDAKNDGSPRLSNESDIAQGHVEQCVVTADCLGGFSLLGGYISNVFKSPKMKAKNAVQNILTLARVLGGNQVTVDNVEAVHAWERVGFQVVARRDNGNGKYDYELVANADSPTVAVEKIKNGEYKPSTKEELESVPTFTIEDIGTDDRYRNYIDACVDRNTKKQAKILAEQKAAENAAKDVAEIHSKAKAEMDKVIEGYKNGKGNKKVAEQAISAIAKKARGEIAMADPRRFVPLARDRFNELVADKRAELKDAKRESPKKKSESETTQTDTVNAKDNDKAFINRTRTKEEIEAVDTALEKLDEDKSDADYYIEYEANDSDKKPIFDTVRRIRGFAKAHYLGKLDRATCLASIRRWRPGESWSKKAKSIVNRFIEGTLKNIDAFDAKYDFAEREASIAQRIAIEEGNKRIDEIREKEVKGEITRSEALDRISAVIESQKAWFEKEIGDSYLVDPVSSALRARAAERGYTTKDLQDEEERRERAKKLVRGKSPKPGVIKIMGRNTVIKTWGDAVDLEAHFKEDGPFNVFVPDVLKPDENGKERPVRNAPYYKFLFKTSLKEIANALKDPDKFHRLVVRKYVEGKRAWAKAAQKNGSDILLRDVNQNITTALNETDSEWADMRLHIAETLIDIHEKATGEKVDREAAMKSFNVERHIQKLEKEKADVEFAKKKKELDEWYADHPELNNGRGRRKPFKDPEGEGSSKGTPTEKEPQKDSVAAKSPATESTDKDTEKAKNENKAEDSEVSQDEGIKAAIKTSSDFADKAAILIAKLNASKNDGADAIIKELEQVQKEAIDALNKTLQGPLTDKERSQVQRMIKSINDYADSVKKAIETYNAAVTKETTKEKGHGHKGLETSPLAKDFKLEMEKLFRGVNLNDFYAINKLMADIESLFKDFNKRTKDRDEKVLLADLYHAYMAKTARDYAFNHRKEKVSRGVTPFDADRYITTFSQEDWELFNKSKEVLGEKLYNKYYLPALIYLDSVGFPVRSVAHESAFLFAKMAQSFHANYGIWIPRTVFAKIRAAGRYGVYDSSINTIGLARDATASTFLHEATHMYEAMLLTFSEMSDREIQEHFGGDKAKAQEVMDRIKQDLASISDWTRFSEEHLAEYKGTDLEGEFEEHAKRVRRGTDIGEMIWRSERLARGMEKYLRTGEAPTSGLKRIFETIKKALQQAFNIRHYMKGELPPEVKAFYDKMVAGDPNFFKEAAKPKERKLKKATVYTDDGHKVNVTYEIVPADTLISSSDYDFAPNDKFPSELQPRDRDRAGMVKQVDDMARGLRADELMEARNVNQGAPVVNQDNIVENGNGRTMAITRAYKHGGDAYTKSGENYKKALVENAEKYGYTKEEIEAMENPVLIRRRGKESDSAQESIINSTTGGMRMGAAQQAQVDAKKISDATMQLLKYDEAAGADLTKSAYSNFVVSALNEIGGEQERDALFQKDGAPSAEGIRRVRAALAAKAYGNSEIIDRAFESTDTDSKNIVNALIAAAPKVSIVKTRLAEGTVDGAYNLPQILTEALGFFLKAKADGKTISFALNETSLFGSAEMEISNPQTKLLVQFLDSHTRSQKAIVSAVDEMVDGILANNMNMDSMFAGVVEPVSMDDIIRHAVGLNSSPFEAKKPGKDGKSKIQIRKLAFGNMSKEHISAIADLAAANGGRLNPKTGAITFKDAESQANALAILEAYYAATSKETDMLKFSMTRKQAKEPRKPIKLAGKKDLGLTGRGWHGSAADFDSFDLSFMGSGEGAQAHGWGIYLALSVPDRGVDDYGKAVSEGYKKRIGGEGGKLYQVALPNSDFLLNEQTPVREQSKFVQAAVKKAFEMPFEHEITAGEIREAKAEALRYTLYDAEALSNRSVDENLEVFSKIFESFAEESPKDFATWNLDADVLNQLYDNVFEHESLDWNLDYSKRENYRPDVFDGITDADARKQYIKDILFRFFTEAQEEIAKIQPRATKERVDYAWKSLARTCEPQRITYAAKNTFMDETRIHLDTSTWNSAEMAISRLDSIIDKYAKSDFGANETARFEEELRHYYSQHETGQKKSGARVRTAIQHTAQKIKDLTKMRESIKSRDVMALNGETIQFLLKHMFESGSDYLYSDTAKEAALRLKDAGLKGYKYYGARDGACAVIFDEAAMKIINKFSRKGPMETLRSSITKFCSASDLTSREKAIVAFAKKMGMTVQFFEGDVNLHGFHADGTNAIFLNRKSAMNLNKVFWHETFHWMRENNSELYNRLVKEVFGDKVSMKQLADYAASIGRTDMSMELCIEEMLADAMFDAGKRGSFFEKIGAEHPSLCAKLLKWISNMYKDFVAHFRNPEAGLTNTQVKRMAASLSEIAGRITDKNGNKLFSVDEKGNIKETAAGREAISADVKYMVTNKNVKPDTQVKVTDVTNATPTNPLDKAKAKALVKSLIGQTFVFNGGTGKVVIYDKKAEPGENFKAGNHLMRSASTSVRKILNTTRQKALTMLANIFQNGIYIDKHDDSVHGKATKYIEIFAPVRDGNKVYTFQITARERGQAGTYEIGEAVYYNVKKTGQPLQVPTKGNKGNGSPVSTVSVADMLAGVNDRDGNPYVNTDGTLNYDNAIFTQVNKNGVHLLSDSATTDQSSSKIKAQLMSNFPNAQNIVEDENHIAFDLPNGTHVEANIVEDTIGVDWSKAQEDYGGTLTGNEKALGKLETVDRDAIITLTKDTVEEAPSHEAMHLAMGFLNGRERDALMKKYGNEEAICEAMREWKIRRSEGKGTSMGKLMQKISDIAYKLLGLFHETDKNVFRKLESGELWTREADNKAAAKVSYMLDPSNAVDEYLNEVAGNIKFSMDSKNSAIDKAFDYLVENGEVGDTILKTGDTVYRKTDTSTMSVTYKDKPDMGKAFTDGKKYFANQAAKASEKVKAKVKPGVHAANQNPHIRKLERGKEGGWGAIEWILNNTVKSPSRIASFAARRIYNIADAANRRMQKLYGDWTNSFARAIQKMNDAEKEKFNDILWAEDANQHVYTDAELKAMGCSDTVIRAHKKTRTLLHKIYKAVNDTYTRTKVENHFYKTLKAAQKAQEDFAKHPHTEVFKDIKETERNGEKRYQVSVRTRGNREIITVATQGQIDDLKQDKDCYLKKVEPMIGKDGKQAISETGEPLFNVTHLAYNKDLTDMEGYVPHLFHGIMIIRTYKDKEGNSHSEVVGSADNMDKAVVLADKMQQEQGGEFLLAPKQFKSEGEVENPLFLGDKDYDALMDNLRDGMSLSLEDAREISKARKKGRHISYSAIKKRKGAKGFETNAIWAIQHHIGASARYVALDPFKEKAISFFERYFGNYDEDWSGKNREAAFVKGYIDSMLGKPGVLEKVANSFLRLFPMFKDEARPAQHLASNLTALTGVLKLGASPAAGFVNVLQILNCVGYVGVRKTGVGIKRALHPTSTDIRILKLAGADEEVGLAFDGIGKVPLERTKYSKTEETLNNIREKLMTPFSVAERTIRRATILAAYYDFVEKNKDRVKDPADLKRLALAHAVEINRKVNFDYSVTDAPRIFRALQGTVIGDIALQFQKYGVKELEVISDFLPILGKDTTTAQKVKFFVPYLLVSGLWNAVPFEDAILALLGMLFGIDDPEKEVKKAMIEWAGNDSTRKAIVDVANYGAGSIVGMDISQRVGLKGAVPETSNILQGGPLGATTIQLAKAITNGDVNGGLKAVSPAIGNAYGAYIGYNTDSKGRKTVDYDGWDRAMRALGFRTTKEAHATDAQSIVYNYKQSKKADREKAKEAYFDNPSDANYQKLRDLGYSKNEIKGFKNNKTTTRAERAENGLTKDDKKKLQSVFDYAK